MYVYCLGRGNYLLIVNASRIEDDFAWLSKLHERFPDRRSVFLENKSDSYGAVAIQGPAAAAIVAEAIPSEESLSTLSKNQVRMVPFAGELIYVARTGYTGEDGFEVIAPAPLIVKVWESLMNAGASRGLKPAGLGARDTLRTEACYPLYGHELNEATTPIEAGLGFFVSPDKGEFVGSSVILGQKTNGAERRLVAFKMAGKSAPPRADYPIFSARGEPLGKTVSGTQSPTLGTGIGLGYVPAASSKPGTTLLIEIRGNRFPAEVIKKPFYKRAVESAA
jgi:aminomethyltransferase